MIGVWITTIFLVLLVYHVHLSSDTEDEETRRSRLMYHEAFERSPPRNNGRTPRHDSDSDKRYPEAWYRCEGYGIGYRPETVFASQNVSDAP